MGRKNSFFSLKSASLRTNRGMTLSEVLVVIAILGILILLAAFFIRPIFQIGKAKDAERKSDLKKIATALEDYATDHGCYPVVDSNWETALVPYLKPVPKDPQTNHSYTYTFPAGEVCEKNGTTVGVKKFAIFTTLESETGTSYSQGNYVVTSPNYSLAPASGSQFRFFGCYDYHCLPIPSPGDLCEPKYQNIQSCVGEGCCFDACIDGHEYGCP